MIVKMTTADTCIDLSGCISSLLFQLACIVFDELSHCHLSVIFSLSITKKTAVECGCSSVMVLV